jgi:hypothetical protein
MRSLLDSSYSIDTLRNTAGEPGNLQALHIPAPYRQDHRFNVIMLIPVMLVLFPNYSVQTLQQFHHSLCS